MAPLNDPLKAAAMTPLNDPLKVVVVVVVVTVEFLHRIVSTHQDFFFLDRD